MTTSTYPNLCDTFRELAAWTCGTLKKANRLGMPFNEETITETLLLTLAERFTGRGLSIRAYTKQEEGKGTAANGGKPTGADWSFWFADVQNMGIELRIQAKRLFRTGRYESLDGRSEQFNNLKNNCGSAIPLYLFYNNDVFYDLFFEPSILQIRPREWICFSCLSDWGCTYAPLKGIPLKNEPGPHEISPMRPWHTLVCERACPCCDSLDDVAAKTLPQRVADAVKMAYEIEAPEQEAWREWMGSDKFSANNKAPEWFVLLDKGDPSVEADAQRSEQISELDRYLDDHGLRGVAIVAEDRELGSAPSKPDNR